MAMNSSPGRTARESIETPASRATGSSAPPGLEPTAAAICAIVQSIKSSADLVCVQRPGIALYLPFWHPNVSRSAKNRVLRVVLFQCLRAWLTRAIRASGVPNHVAFLPKLPPSLAALSRGGSILISPLYYCAASHFAIVKLERAIGKNLVIFVAFSGQQNNVAGASFIHRQPDGLLPIRLDNIFAAGFLHPDNDVANNFQRIFLARIVTGKNGEITEPPGNFAHNRPLGAVLGAATTKERNDAALGVQFARGANQAFERVVRVCVIDDDKVRLALINALESARHTFKISDARFDRFIGKAERLRYANGSKNVVHVDAPHQAGGDLDFAVRCLRGEGKSVET